MGATPPELYAAHTAGSLRLLIIMATEKWYGQNRTGRTGRAGPELMVLMDCT